MVKKKIFFFFSFCHFSLTSACSFCRVKYFLSDLFEESLIEQRLFVGLFSVDGDGPFGELVLLESLQDVLEYQSRGAEETDVNARFHLLEGEDPVAVSKPFVFVTPTEEEIRLAMLELEMEEQQLKSTPPRQEIKAKKATNFMLGKEEEEIFRLASSEEESHRSSSNKWRSASPRSEGETRVERSDSLTSPRSKTASFGLLPRCEQQQPFLGAKKKKNHMSDSSVVTNKIKSLKQRVKMSDKVEVMEGKLSSAPVKLSKMSPRSILRAKKPPSTMLKVGSDVTALCELDQRLVSFECGFFFSSFLSPQVS